MAYALNGQVDTRNSMAPTSATSMKTSTTMRFIIEQSYSSYLNNQPPAFFVFLDRRFRLGTKISTVGLGLNLNTLRSVALWVK